MNNNFILNTDSYKFSHGPGILPNGDKSNGQYPPNTNTYFGYIESRGCNRHWNKLLFFGLQAFIKEYLLKPITKENIIQAEMFCKQHGVPFNKEGWEYILDKYSGYLPIKIKALPEGGIYPLSIPLVTVESTDSKVFWIGSFIETSLLRAIWYPTTVATNSWYMRQIIKNYMKKTCDNLDGLDFKLHDFSARGVSSSETAALGGMAHLATGAKGSDTIEGVLAAYEYYNEPMAGYSIPAAEHSSITSWGKENELYAYRNMLKQFAKPGSIVAIVSDSYDIYNACEKLWGETLKQEIIDSGATIVIRPDSGQPDIVVRKCIEILDSKFGHSINSKGYKVINNVRLIQGDGINEHTIANILGILEVYGYSTENIAFGSGGALAQQLDRDTLKFAMKCSAIKINNTWVDVFKDPKTDQGKKSKKGRLTTVLENNEYKAVKLDDLKDTKNDCMNLIYENGKLISEINFTEVRQNSNKEIN